MVVSPLDHTSYRIALYKPDESRRLTRCALAGEDLLVFLAPTHAQGVYGCTVLRKPNEAALRDLREALRKLEGR